MTGLAIIGWLALAAAWGYVTFSVGFVIWFGTAVSGHWPSAFRMITAAAILAAGWYGLAYTAPFHITVS